MKYNTKTEEVEGTPEEIRAFLKPKTDKPKTEPKKAFYRVEPFLSAHKGKYSRFTQKEDLLLKALYAQHFGKTQLRRGSADIIARRLGRTKKTVLARANALGISRNLRG